MVSVGKGKVRWVVGLVVLVFVVSGCFGGKDYRGMRFDADNLEELTEAFFYTGEPSRSECVKRLGSVRWERSGGNGNTQGLTVSFIYDKEGYRYDFFYVENTGMVDPYHLTVNVHKVPEYRWVHGASLQGNRFGTAAKPVMEEKWKRLLDDDVREDLDRQVPDSEQERWNRKVLEEYTGVLRCFFDERGRK